MPARPKIDRDRVKQLLAQGVRQVDIARRLGCSVNGLSTAIAKMRRETEHAVAARVGRRHEW